MLVRLHIVSYLKAHWMPLSIESLPSMKVPENKSKFCVLLIVRPKTWNCRLSLFTSDHHPIVSLFIRSSICLFDCQSVHSIVSLLIWLSVCLFNRQSVYSIVSLFIRLSDCLFDRQSFLSTDPSRGLKIFKTGKHSAIWRMTHWETSITKILTSFITRLITFLFFYSINVIYVYIICRWCSG